MYRKLFKRFFDLILSLVGLIVLSPVLLLTALAIKLDSKGPVMFTQKRVGKDKKYFRMYKFRSMYIDTPHDMPTHLLESPEKYITRVGKIIRRTSIDELPQLFNIIKGDMAIIGPRPALYNQDDLVAERDRYNANSVRPGLTGWAQINGRDELPIDVKARYDGEYCEKLSLGFDIKCFLMTIGKVISHDGFVEGAAVETQQGRHDGEDGEQ